MSPTTIRVCKQCPRDIHILSEPHEILYRPTRNYYFCDETCFRLYMELHVTWLKGLYKEGIVERVIP